jgi:acetylornithine deacetylase/succinyl-diaminopimelate desuccinylase-like protein
MTHSISTAIATFLFFVSAAASSASVEDVLADVREFRTANEVRILADFRELLAMPNVSANLADMDRNAEWISAYLEDRGFNTTTVSAARAPYIIAERLSAGAVKTILIYAHFDGQPVAPDDWSSAPFEPVLRDGTVESGGKVLAWPEKDARVDPEWRVFARSAGDDKAPIIALMAALDALDEAGISPGVNIKLFLDGEEEAGSPSLEQILDQHAAALDADLMLFCDGPMHQSRRRQLVFGVRGSMTMELTTYGATRPLHSGHYGNWAPNPTDDLIRLLNTLKDETGSVQVANYYDEVLPPTDAEIAAIDAMPRVDDQLRRELSLGRTEGVETRIEMLMLEPAIVIKGLQGGGVGAQASNVIRPSATASLNIRLVPAQTPEIVRGHLENHFRAEGFHIVYEDPTPEVLASHPRVLKVDAKGGYPGFRTALDGPEARQLVSLLDQIDGMDTLLTPTMGGSLPIHLFEQALDMPIILLPTANHDNNQHGSNENLRIQNLWDAIEVFAVLVSGYGEN